MPDKQETSVGPILNAMKGGVIILDRAARITGWNAWMASASGVAAVSAHGRTLAEVFPGARLERLLTAVDAALTSNASTLLTHTLNPGILPLRGRSSRELLHEIAVSPLGDACIAGSLVFVTDVTMTARREQYLRQQQSARYEAVVAGSPDVILTVDETGLIQSANAAACACFGHSKAELIDTDAAALFVNGAEWTSMLQGVMAGGPERTGELAVGKAGAASRQFEASASRWTMGSRLFATFILRDVTERRAIEAALRRSEAEARSAADALAELNQTLELRVQTRSSQLMRAEEALRHSQKMEAIGNLTGGIAHDFNNLLHVIGGNLQLLMNDVNGNVHAERRVRVALDSVARSAKLSSQLLAFARRQPLAPKAINLGRFIRDMEEILRKVVGEDVAVETVIGAELWNTLIDPGNLESTLLNLAVNARDAMEGKGRLAITLRNVFVDSKYTDAVEDEVIRGQYVLLEIADTGCGMPAGVIEHVFEPFYTTKPVGKGTGLGLSMVYGFVRQSGGHIKVDSEVGRGTTIKIYLPRSMQGEDRHAEPAAGPAMGGSELVLVVEDDDAVRETVVSMFNDLGYNVLKARDAQGALSIIESGMPIDLLFTDVVMPGPLKSTELANEARERIPGLAVLFTSGYAADAIVNAGRQNGSVELLSKPYSLEALALKVRQLLAVAQQRKGVREPHGRMKSPQ